VVLDHVGGDGLADAIEAACEGGNVISVGRLGGPRATIDMFALARRHVRLRSVCYGLTPPSVLGDLFDALAPVVLSALGGGRIRAIVDRFYAFDEADAAMERQASRNAEAKVVLELS
jgi:NADPH:quinone reductase-like Zn-dependent oxidoreductase